MDSASMFAIGIPIPFIENDTIAIIHEIAMAIDQLIVGENVPSKVYSH